MKELFGVIALFVMVLAFAVLASNAIVSSLTDRDYPQWVNNPKVVGLSALISIFTVLSGLIYVADQTSKDDTKPEYEQVTETFYRKVK